MYRNHKSKGGARSSLGSPFDGRGTIKTQLPSPVGEDADLTYSSRNGTVVKSPNQVSSGSNMDLMKVYNETHTYQNIIQVKVKESPRRNNKQESNSKPVLV